MEASVSNSLMPSSLLAYFSGWEKEKAGNPVKFGCSDIPQTYSVSCLLGTEKAQLALCMHLP